MSEELKKAKRIIEDLLANKVAYCSKKEQRRILEAVLEFLKTSEGGEYIKKSEALSKAKYYETGLTTGFEYVTAEDLNSLPTYSIPETAKPEEGAELIDRRQIKWYGCDHEGRIKGINCETADCSKCFYATVEHDEVMSLPVYRIPGSAIKTGGASFLEEVTDIDAGKRIAELEAKCYTYEKVIANSNFAPVAETSLGYFQKIYSLDTPAEVAKKIMSIKAGRVVEIIEELQILKGGTE